MADQEYSQQMAQQSEFQVNNNFNSSIYWQALGKLTEDILKIYLLIIKTSFIVLCLILPEFNCFI